MTQSHGNRKLAVCLCFAVAVLGFSSSTIDATAAAQTVGSTADDQLRERVEAALRADPYFYDAHVEVSIRKGDVVLRGFVFSDWDLRDALRIARKAAGARLVVDELSIEVGGRR